MLKLCHKCGVRRPVSDFYVMKKYGPASPCIPCRRAHSLAYQKAHRTEKNEYAKRRVAAFSPEQRAVYLVRQRENQARRLKDPVKKAQHRRVVRANYLKRKYGLTLEAFDSLYKVQRGTCAICRGRFPLKIDHSHVTTAVRGLLCNSCNWLLGYAKDNVTILKAAIRYLKR